MKSVQRLAAWLLKGGLMGTIFFDDLVGCGVVYKAAGFKFYWDFCLQTNENYTSTHKWLKHAFNTTIECMTMH